MSPARAADVSWLSQFVVVSLHAQGVATEGLAQGVAHGVAHDGLLGVIREAASGDGESQQPPPANTTPWHGKGTSL